MALTQLLWRKASKYVWH